MFNDFSQHLYSNPGTLSIELKDSGFKFDVDIERSGSQGVGFMKTFCYDLVYTILQVRKEFGFHMLIHDSTIFDGVGERQVVKALQLAHKLANDNGFQYICTLNTDIIPYKEMVDIFKLDFEKSIKKVLSDKDEESGLLGIRF